MTQISVYEILSSQNAMFSESGLKLERSIYEALEQHEYIEISFAQIKTLTSQFLYASFKNIIEERGDQFFLTKIRINHISHLITHHEKSESSSPYENLFSKSQIGLVYA